MEKTGTHTLNMFDCKQQPAQATTNFRETRAPPA